MPCSATCSVKKVGVIRFPTGRPCMSGKASTTVSMEPSAIPAAMNSSPGMTHDVAPTRHRPFPLYAGAMFVVASTDPRATRIEGRRAHRAVAA